MDEVQPCIFLYFAPMVLAEIALCLWLLVIGVNVLKIQSAT